MFYYFLICVFQLTPYELNLLYSIVQNLNKNKQTKQTRFIFASQMLRICFFFLTFVHQKPFKISNKNPQILK